MTDANRPETFEAYPYQPDPGEATGPREPEPREVAPLRPLPRVGPQVTTGTQGIGRRGMLAGVAALAGVVGIGVFGLRAVDSGPTGGEDVPPPLEPDPAQTEPAEVPTSGLLTTENGDLWVEIPVGWTLESDVKLLVVRHDDGRLAARSPEQATADEDALAREADYLRDDFDPAGDPRITDESDTRFSVLLQTTQGHLGAEAATEHVALIVNNDAAQSIVVSWVTVDGKRAVTAEARTMERALRRGFEEL